ncbi:MAG TPA: hypothetical protein VGM64_06800 [Lacunisphaera sp.]|jgi:glycosyltransferase involved in cell wall biosynthesis
MTAPVNFPAGHLPPLNLFYGEPDFDRWLPFDRFPRAAIRRLLRGALRPGGQMRVFLNLCAGLDEIGQSYRVNDYRFARCHPDELCCVLGKRHVLDSHPWANPLLLGPCIHDHPVTDPDLFRRRRVRRILVPGEWMRKMCEPYWGNRVHAWPVGLDTQHWAPSPQSKTLDFILYNKIRWDHAARETILLTPIRAELDRLKLSYVEIKYGSYAPGDFKNLLGSAHAMLFVCEHETQGLACQEALSSGVPVLAWDHGGEWLDPEFHPHRVHYAPVSSVPYWDERCGVRFASAVEFPAALDDFIGRQKTGHFNPRQYIIENLGLGICAAKFVEHARIALTLDDATDQPAFPAKP